MIVASQAVLSFCPQHLAEYISIHRPRLSPNVSPIALSFLSLLHSDAVDLAVCMRCLYLYGRLGLSQWCDCRRRVCDTIVHVLYVASWSSRIGPMIRHKVPRKKISRAGHRNHQVKVTYQNAASSPSAVSGTEIRPATWFPILTNSSLRILARVCLSLTPSLVAPWTANKLGLTGLKSLHISLLTETLGAFSLFWRW